MSTLRGTDVATDKLLDFIAGGVPENPDGESLGNYNAVIGDAHASDDLSQKTLVQIYDLQKSFLAAGKPSTAIGRYQFLLRTLQGLANKLGVADSTLFTPELQDRFAVELLRGRGYSKWWNGGLSDSDFAHNLSLEWASLPDPENAGKSHYDGVGPNHAGTTLDNVYTVLAQVRQLIGAPTPTPAPALSGADKLNRAELESLKGAVAGLAPAVPSAASAAQAPISGGAGLAIGGGTAAVGALPIKFLWTILMAVTTGTALPVMDDPTAAAFAGIAALLVGWLAHKGGAAKLSTGASK